MSTYRPVILPNAPLPRHTCASPVVRRPGYRQKKYAVFFTSSLVLIATITHNYGGPAMCRESAGAYSLECKTDLSPSDQIFRSTLRLAEARAKAIADNSNQLHASEPGQVSNDRASINDKEMCQPLALPRFRKDNIIRSSDLAEAFSIVAGQMECIYDQLDDISDAYSTSIGANRMIEMSTFPHLEAALSSKDPTLDAQTEFEKYGKTFSMLRVPLSELTLVFQLLCSVEAESTAARNAWSRVLMGPEHQGGLFHGILHSLFGIDLGTAYDMKFLQRVVSAAEGKSQGKRQILMAFTSRMLSGVANINMQANVAQDALTAVLHSLERFVPFNDMAFAVATSSSAYGPAWLEHAEEAPSRPDAVVAALLGQYTTLWQMNEMMQGVSRQTEALQLFLTDLYWNSKDGGFEAEMIDVGLHASPEEPDRERNSAQSTSKFPWNGFRNLNSNGLLKCAKEGKGKFL